MNQNRCHLLVHECNVCRQRYASRHYLPYPLLNELSGVWKGKSKKNRAIVLVAQEEWKLTWEAKRGQLWIRHVKGHSDHEWNDMADALADDGRRGKIQATAGRAVD